MAASNDSPCLSFHLLNSSVQEKYLIPTIVCELGGIYVIRTLDPEDQHQISLARIFQAADLNIVDGLLRFELVESVDYHTKLGFSGPNLLEIWTNVTRVRSIVAELWRVPPRALMELLAPSLDTCWTLFDTTRSSLLHNWKLTSIAPESYSTSLLLRTAFMLQEIEYLTQKSKWIRSGIPRDSSAVYTQNQDDTAILKWSIAAAGRHESQDASHTDADDWIQVISVIEKLYGLRSDTATEDMRRLRSSVAETAVAASFERLQRHATTKAQASRKAARAKLMSQKSKRTIAVQTDVSSFTNQENRSRSALHLFEGLLTEATYRTEHLLLAFALGVLVGAMYLAQSHVSQST